MGTAFGPVNVAIHAISASLKLGDPRTATETGEALDLAAMPTGLVGRRTQVNLDLARAYAMPGKTRPRSTSCWPPNGSAPSWSATTSRPGKSSPNCCAASTARRRRSCGPSRAAWA
jgi:hypothetical protein